MVKKHKKKNNAPYEEKPKTKIAFLSEHEEFDVTSLKEAKCSVTNNTEITSEKVEVGEVMIVEDKDKPTEAKMEEEFVEAMHERPMNSRNKHQKFRAANDLRGDPQPKKGVDLNIPSSSRNTATTSGDFRRTENRNLSKNDTNWKTNNSNKWNKITEEDTENSGKSNAINCTVDKSFDKSVPNVNKRFDEWSKLDYSGKFTNVSEVFGDLFTASDEYSLGHCVAEDMNMGSGIATTFRSLFKNVPELLQQRQSQGGLAILQPKPGRFIYYLVTKPFSSGKPTYETLFRSLVKMRSHVIENSVKKVALPQIGCGLDQLEWRRVKSMLQYIFEDVNVEIKVYVFQMDSNAVSAPPNKQRKCRVVNVLKPIRDIESYTIILYPCCVENHVSNVMRDLDEKFSILKDYRTSTRCLGTVIRTVTYRKDYIIYGVVVKEKPNDSINYIQFHRCLSQVNKENGKDLFEYVAIEAFEEPSDEKVVTKLVNLMRYTLKLVDVYICWPKHLERKAPPEAQYY